MPITEALSVIGIAVGIAAALGAASLVFVTSRRKAADEGTLRTIDLLRAELEVEREARAEAERRCSTRIASLEGKLDVLTGTFAEELAAKVAHVLADALAKAGYLDRRT